MTTKLTKQPPSVEAFNFEDLLTPYQPDEVDKTLKDWEQRNRADYARTFAALMAVRAWNLYTRWFLATHKDFDFMPKLDAHMFPGQEQMIKDVKALALEPSLMHAPAHDILLRNYANSTYIAEAEFKVAVSAHPNTRKMTEHFLRVLRAMCNTRDAGFHAAADTAGYLVQMAREIAGDKGVEHVRERQLADMKEAEIACYKYDHGD